MKTRLPSLLAAVLCLAFAAPALADSGWTTDFAKAQDQANTDDKAILLNFTGSDWCPWCMKMKRETFDQPAFRDYASQNLELVMLDFPNHMPQSAQVKQQNRQLGKKYKFKGAFPTFILLSKDGRVLWRQEGYLAGGPAAFIAEMNKHYQAPPRTGGSLDGSTGGTTDDFDSLFKKVSPTPTP